MKTASDLFNEFYDKPPIERVNRAVQNYVFDYQQAIIDGLKNRITVLEINAEIQDKMIENAISYATNENLDSPIYLDELISILKGEME